MSALKNCDGSVESLISAIRSDAAEGTEYDYLGSALVKLKSDRREYRNSSMLLATLQKYSSGLPGTAAHVFRLAEELRRWSLDQQSSRLVMFRGMSGAGKSDAFRYMLQHFIFTDVMQTTLNGVNEERDLSKPLGFIANPMLISPETSATVKKFYASMCLLTAFGSAPTEKNPWSSRIGQYFQLQFSSQGRILNATAIPVFTEMLRCNPKDANVGALFIQHLLVHARNKPEYLQLNSSFRDIYTQYKDVAFDSELYHLHDICVNWGGMHEDHWENIIKVVASVVHLQNLTILGSETTMISANSKPHIAQAEQLLGIEAGGLMTCILKKVDDRPSRPAGATMECRPLESKIIVDLLCNELMVRALNSSLDHLRTNHTLDMSHLFNGKATSDGALHIFDPAGWERYMPQTPGNFYQYLNHYIEEKYNGFAIQQQFLGELYTYQDEGIQLDFIAQPNISAHLDLLEQSPGGLIALLEDAGTAQKPDDKAFADKAIMNFSRTKLVRSGGAKTKPTTFVVRHSFAEVGYDCEGFIFANKLSEPSPLVINCLKTSNIAFLNTPVSYAPLLSPPAAPVEEVKPNKLTKAKIVLQYTKFLQMTDKVLTYLSTCEKKSFVLCVNASEAVDEGLLTGQLQTLLIPNLVELARFGFGYRLLYHEFFQRYRLLAKFEHSLLPITLSRAQENDLPKMKSLCQVLMEEVINIIARLGMTDLDLSQGLEGLALFGKTSIFVKDAFAEQMERARFTYFERFTTAAVRLQAFQRMRKARNSYLYTRLGVVTFQSFVRCFLQRKRFLVTFAAALKMKTWWLTKRTQRHFQRMKRAVLLIKAKLLGKMVQRIRYQRLLRAARKFQQMARGCIQRRASGHVYDAVILLQRTFKALLTRRRHIKQRQLAISRIQRVYRGYKARQRLGNLVEILKLRKDQRVVSRVVRKLQSMWRGKLQIARFQEIVAATILLQRWFLACLHRGRFLRVRALAVWLQSQARRLSASKRTNAIKVGNMVREEKGSLSTLYLAEVHCIQSTKDTILTTGFMNHGRDRYERDVITYDISFDLSIAYPEGWLPTILQFAQELKSKENRLIEILAIGAQHTILVDDYHHVYTMGLGDLGQLGHNNRKSYPQPRRIEHMQRYLFQGEAKVPNQINPKMGITSVVCGQDHTLLLTQAKKIFSWGDNRRGQLGHSAFESCAIPRLVTFTHSINKQQTPLQNVRSIYAGKYHSAALAENGFAYVWGAGEVCCLGIDRAIVLDADSLHDLSRVDLYQVVKQYYRDISCRYDPQQNGVTRHVIDFCEPRNVSVLNKRTIYTMASGESHLTVVTNDGVYAWGVNLYGQLGLEHTKDSHVVSRLRFLTVNAGVAASGNNSPGVPSTAHSGHGHSAPRKTPTTNTATPKGSKAGSSAGSGAAQGNLASSTRSAVTPVGEVHFTERDWSQTELFCGGRHVVMKTRLGELWAWGWNKFGQVGDNTMVNVIKPVRIFLQSSSTDGLPAGSVGQNDPAVAVALGWRSSMAIGKSGRIFGWGISSCLAQAPALNQAAAMPSDDSVHSTSAPATNTVSTDDPFELYLAPTLLPDVPACTPQHVQLLQNKNASGRGLHCAAGFALSVFLLDRTVVRDHMPTSAADQSSVVSALSDMHLNSSSRGFPKASTGVSSTGMRVGMQFNRTLEIQRAQQQLQASQGAVQPPQPPAQRYDIKTGSQKNNTSHADEVLQRFKQEVGRLHLAKIPEKLPQKKARNAVVTTNPLPATAQTTNLPKRRLSLQATSGDSAAGQPSSLPQQTVSQTSDQADQHAAPKLAVSGANSPMARSIQGGRRLPTTSTINQPNLQVQQSGNGSSSPSSRSRSSSPARGRLYGQYQPYLQSNTSFDDASASARALEFATLAEAEEEAIRTQTLQQQQQQQRETRLAEPGALLDLFSPMHHSKIKARRQQQMQQQQQQMQQQLLVQQQMQQSMQHHGGGNNNLVSSGAVTMLYTSQSTDFYGSGNLSGHHVNPSPLRYLQRTGSPGGNNNNNSLASSSRVVAYEVSMPQTSNGSNNSRGNNAGNHGSNKMISNNHATTQRSDMLFLQSFLSKTAASHTAVSAQNQQQQFNQNTNNINRKTANYNTNNNRLSIDVDPSQQPGYMNPTANTFNYNSNNNRSPLKTPATATGRRLSASLRSSDTSNNSVGGGVSGASDPHSFRRQMQELGYLKRLDKPRSGTPTSYRTAL